MSKMSELAQCVDELRNAAQSLTTVADSLTALFSGGEEKPVEKVSPAVKESQTRQKPNPITLEQVRAVLVEKSRSGHTEKVRVILKAHGAAKLSEIEPKEYPALLAEAAEIGLADGDSNG